MFDLIKKLFTPKDGYVGVLPDNRTPEEKARDWQAEEIAAAGSMVPKFRKVKKGEWKKYTVRDQDGSGSCVSQAIAKGFEVLYKNSTGKTVVFSATPIYKKRKNAPDAGMYIHDAFGIAVKDGTCEERLCPSQKMSDKAMDASVLPANFEDVNDLVDASAYVSLPKDFDYIAAWIEKTGYANIHIAADRRRWSLDFPKLGSTNRGVQHAVAGIDAVNYQGEDYIVIEDSWGEFGEFKGQRLLSRAVFNDMYTRGAGITVFEYDVVKKTKFARFDTWLEYGNRSSEVTRLQDYLKAKGFFPSNVDSTGYYGEITALALYNFQVAYAVASPIILNKSKGKYCHKLTLDVINKNL